MSGSWRQSQDRGRGDDDGDRQLVLRLGSDAPGPPDRGPAVTSGELERLLPTRRVRCECAVCGVHTIVISSLTIGGWCPNCGSCDLRPLERPGSDR